MAKYELSLKADFDKFVAFVKDGVLRRSSTVSLEEESRITTGNVRIYAAAYERYAFVGKNRSSLNVTFVGCGEIVHLIGFGTGGSSAMFFKVNTWSEEAFLDTLIEAAEEYMRERGIEPLYTNLDDAQDE